MTAASAIECRSSRKREAENFGPPLLLLASANIAEPGARFVICAKCDTINAFDKIGAGVQLSSSVKQMSAKYPGIPNPPSHQPRQSGALRITRPTSIASSRLSKDHTSASEGVCGFAA